MQSWNCYILRAAKPATAPHKKPNKRAKTYSFSRRVDSGRKGYVEEEAVRIFKQKGKFNRVWKIG